MVLNDMAIVNNQFCSEKKYYLAYWRKSSESEDRQVQSIEDQKRELSPVISQNSLAVLEEFEESKSAKAPGRSEFDRMIKLINERDDIKGIVCWKLNRLSRNPIDSGTLQWLLQSKKIEEIVTPTTIYKEADSDFTMAIEGAQASRFIRDLREDTWRGTKSKIEKGIAPLLASPGYKNDKTKDQGERDIIVDSVQFPLMRKLFDLALTGDYSITDLYYIASDMGIKTSRGKEISRSRMSVILKNVFYTGKFVYAGKIYEGVHMPMLSQSEFDLLQDIFSRGDRPRSNINEHPYPNGLIRCICGRALVFEPKLRKYLNGNSQSFNYLRCNRHKYHPSSLCPKSSINIDDLHPQIIEKLGTVKISEDLVRWGIKRLNEKNIEKQRTREAQSISIKTSYDQIVAKLDNLLQLKLSPLNVHGSLLSDQEYADERACLIKERNKYNAQHISVDKDREEWAELAVGVFNFAAKAQEKYTNGDLETRKNICRIFGTSLLLNGKSLEVYPRTPFVYIAEAIESSEPKKEAIQGCNTVITPPNTSYWVDDGIRTRDLLLHREAL